MQEKSLTVKIDEKRFKKLQHHLVATSKTCREFIRETIDKLRAVKS